jgi:hypothetical protein
MSARLGVAPDLQSGSHGAVAQRYFRGMSRRYSPFPAFPDLVNLTMPEYLLAIVFCSVGSFRQTEPRAHGHPALTPEPTPPLPLLSEFGKIPVEADHDFLAILVLPAYRLSEPGETPASTLPAKRSQ